MKVFLHGWGMRKEMFSSFIDEYCRDEQVLCLSLPGYDEACEVESFEQQVVLLSKMIPEGSHLVAWSLGGLFALKAAELFPDKVSRLTMLSSTPLFAAKEDWVHGLKKHVLSNFGANLLQDRKKTLTQFMLLQLHGEKNIKSLIKVLNNVIKENASPSLRALELGLTFLQKIDLREELKSIKTEVCFILGGRDRIVLSGQMNDLKAMGQHVEVHIIKSAGHLPFITRPAEVAAFL